MRRKRQSDRGSGDRQREREPLKGRGRHDGDGDLGDRLGRGAHRVAQLVLLRAEAGEASRAPRSHAGNGDHRQGGYSPNLIRVKEGVPLRLVFDRQENSDCSSRVVFPDFGVSKSLAAFGRTTVELMPARTGEFGFACGMNMLHGTLVVEAGNGSGEMPAETSETALVASNTAPLTTHAHEVARAVGVGPTRQVSGTSRVEFALRADGVACPTCVTNIGSLLERLPGVDRVETNYGAERLMIDFDSSQIRTEDMRRDVQAAGYRVEERRQPGSADTED